MPAALSTAVSVSARGAIAPPKAAMNGGGISASGGAKTEAGSGTGCSSSKIVGLASPLVKTPKIAEPLVEMRGAACAAAVDVHQIKFLHPSKEPNTKPGTIA